MPSYCIVAKRGGPGVNWEEERKKRRCFSFSTSSQGKGLGRPRKRRGKKEKKAEVFNLGRGNGEKGVDGGPVGKKKKGAPEVCVEANYTVAALRRRGERKN